MLNRWAIASSAVGCLPIVCSRGSSRLSYFHQLAVHPPTNRIAALKVQLGAPPRQGHVLSRLHWRPVSRIALTICTPLELSAGCW